MYVVTVGFEIKPEHFDAFLAQMSANARASREREPGCLQFDVCTDPANPTHVFLYEVYVDRAAFDAHIATEHFKAFDRLVAPYVATKRVRTYDRFDPA